MDILKLTAIGRLACDPQSGHGTVKLSLIYTPLDEKVRPTTVAIYANGALAEICEKNLQQGSRIYCEAHIEDGGYIADEIIMLGHKPKP
jgi:single-stranded DNA-binding protein